MAGGGAQYVPKTFEELEDVPAFSGNELKVFGLDAGGTPTFVDQLASGSIFTNWKSIYDATLTAPYVAAGSKVETTLAAGITAGQNTATLVDADSYAELQDMAIPGAGVAGAELIVNITDKTGDVVTFTPNTSTTVSSGITVYHDDTQACQAFFDSTNGQNRYIHGDFVVNGEMFLDNPAQIILGGNLFTFAAFASSLTSGAVFHQRSLTANTFNVRAASIKMGGISVETVGGTATAGAHWVLGESAAGQDASFLDLTHCRSRYAYIGILVQNGWEHTINNWQITHPVKHGIKVETAAGYGYGGHRFKSMHGWETSGNADSFIYITGVDFNMWDDTKAAGFNTVFHIDGSFRNVGPQTITHTHCDNAKGISLKVEKASSNLVSGPKISQFSGLQWEIGANPFVSIGAGVTGTVLNAVHSRGKYGGGFEDGGDDTTMTGCTVGVESLNLTAYDAFILKSTSNGVTLSGCRGTRRRYGLVAETGVTNANVVGNNFGGNNTGATNIASGVIDTSIIENNTGADDVYIASVASAPNRIGQKAVVGTTIYFAVGTAAAGDWEALN